ncbi:MAG: hypothetical protein ACI4FN_06065 [Acutalibacteraceae bacterium]
MNVWIMNLKDMRDDKPLDLPKSKFEFCKENGIIGIGWAGHDPSNSNDTTFLQADNAIENMEAGDLVWVKNTFAENGEEKFYICEIIGKAQESTDEIFKEYDIGKMCTCKFYSVKNFPDDFDPNKITGRHTIEKANDTISNITPKILSAIKEKDVTSANSSDEQKNINSLFQNKKVIVSLICVLAIILGIIFVPISVKAVNKKAYPILPDGLEFGMTYENAFKMGYFDQYKDLESFEKFNNASYDKFGKYYFNSMLSSAPAMASFIDKLSAKTGSKSVSSSVYFNQDKELYAINFDIEMNENVFNNLCNYFKKTFGKGKIVSEDNKKEITFSRSGVKCYFCNYLGLVTITSTKYEPNIPEISKDSINEAFNSINYSLDSYFKMNLKQLLDQCVTNFEGEYYALNEITHSGCLNARSTFDKLNDSAEGAYSEFAPTSYVVTVHGDICQNPSLPYLINEDVDVIKVLLIFDKNEVLQGYKIIEQCQDLSTYATLYMIS